MSYFDFAATKLSLEQCDSICEQTWNWVETGSGVTSFCHEL